ncbi:hypothetical protein EJB05_50056, partial [Eragrostis curvula]
MQWRDVVLPLAASVLFFLWLWLLFQFPNCDEGDDEELRSPVVLPHFPYVQARAPEPPPLCAICLDELQQGQMCSEVPACRHIFHHFAGRGSCKGRRAGWRLPMRCYGDTMDTMEVPSLALYGSATGGRDDVAVME